MSEKLLKNPTVIYRTVSGTSHVLNYTTGEIMSFGFGEEGVLELKNRGRIKVLTSPVKFETS